MSRKTALSAGETLSVTVFHEIPGCADRQSGRLGFMARGDELFTGLQLKPFLFCGDCSFMALTDIKDSLVRL